MDVDSIRGEFIADLEAAFSNRHQEVAEPLQERDVDVNAEGA